MKNDFEFSGIGSGFNPHDGNTAAFLREGSAGKRRLLMIDSGEQTFSAMLRNGVLEDSADASLLLTHLHTDHVGSLGNLALYYKFVKNNPLKIYLPEELNYVRKIEKLLEIFDVAPDWVKILAEKELDGKFDSFDTVRYVPTKHANSQLSFGLDLTTADGDIYYTGDTKEITQVINKLNSGRHIKQIYADMSSIKSAGSSSVHTSVEDYEKRVQRGERRLLTGIHFNNRDVKNYAQSVGFNIPEIYKGGSK